MGSNEDTIQIYKGIGLKKGSQLSTEPKQFVFDLDETIGSFSDLYLLFQCIESLQTTYNFTLYDNPSDLVYELLNLYPEFFRYGIEIVLAYLHKKKSDNSCSGVHLYTNNSCLPDSWAFYITRFIEEKWELPGLFDTVVRAFKIGGKIVEKTRTTTEKTHNDLLRCLLLPQNTEFCYIDNDRYPKMEHRYVYYLQPRPYHHYMNRSDILDRFFKSELCNRIFTMTNQDLSPIMIKWYTDREYSMTTNNRELSELDVDLHVSKKLLKYIRRFFHMSIRRPHTRHIRKVGNAVTMRKRS